MNIIKKLSVNQQKKTASYLIVQFSELIVRVAVMTVDYRTALLAFLMIAATCVVAQNPESKYSVVLILSDFTV